MENSVKVSFIVPVYNVERYLEKCLESILNQTLKEIEIICINDDSKDKSLEILKEYEEKHNKIKIINKEKNEGVLNARIDGLKIAQGEYVAFIDSDDYIKEDFAEKMYEQAINTNSDITVCAFYRIKSEKDYAAEMTNTKNKVIYIEKEPEEFISVNTALWNKLYKKSIFEEMYILKEPPKVLEDMMFLMIILPKAKKITFIQDPLYYYMVRQNSAMTSIEEEQIKVIENSFIELKKHYELDKKRSELLSVLDAMAFLHCGISLMFRISTNKNINFRKKYKENELFLNKEFPGWKKCKYLKISYIIKNKSSNLKVGIVKKIYQWKIFGLFLKIYNFCIERLKVDIKW